MPLKRALFDYIFTSPRNPARWIVALVFTSLVCCAKAHAWTDAKVQGVHTRIELSENGVADVAMTIKIRVRGGWLSRFEITGLDEDIVFAATRPAVLISEEGRRYIPEIKVRDPGNVVLKFTDTKRVPRRGSYLCELRYATASIANDSENTGDDKHHAYWSLPPWPVGLEDIQIEIVTPLGSRPLALSEEESFVEHRGYHDDDNQTVLSWRRVHLPRTVAWKVGFTLPGQSVIQSAPVRSAVPTSNDLAKQPSAMSSCKWIALLLGIFALLKRLLVLRICRKRRIEVIPLFAPDSERLRDSLIILFAFAAYLLFDSNRVTALVLCCLVVVLSIDKRYRRRPFRQIGEWREVTKRDLQIARFSHYQSLFDFAAWLDATTPLGIALLLTNYVLSFLLYWQGDNNFAYSWTCGVILVTPLFLTGTRKNFPLSPEATLNILSDFVIRGSMKDLSESDIGCSLLLYKTPSGEWHEARLRFRSDMFTDGLQQLDLVIAVFSPFHATDPDIALLSVAAAGSPADRILNTRLKTGVTYSASMGGRVARVTRSTTFQNEIQSLLHPL